MYCVQIEALSSNGLFPVRRRHVRAGDLEMRRRFAARPNGNAVHQIDGQHAQMGAISTSIMQGGSGTSIL